MDKKTLLKTIKKTFRRPSKYQSFWEKLFQDYELDFSSWSPEDFRMLAEGIETENTCIDFAEQIIRVRVNIPEETKT